MKFDFFVIEWYEILLTEYIVMSDMEKLNEDLNYGKVLPELSFSKRFGTGSNIDRNRYLYNSFYRSYQFYEKLYGKEITGFPRFYQVVYGLVETKINNDPLTEYNNRFSGQSIDRRIISDTVLQSTCESEGE